jgi:hypothetical protein
MTEARLRECKANIEAKLAAMTDDHGYIGDAPDFVEAMSNREVLEWDVELYQLALVGLVVRNSGVTATTLTAMERLTAERDRWAARVMKLEARLDNVRRATLDDAYEIVARFDLLAHLERQIGWSRATFGPGRRTLSVTNHIRKELAEIEAEPHDLVEWIDVVILALDGAWRSGHQPADIVATLVAKQTKNEGRKWPDWRALPPDAPTEHVREAVDG